MIQYSYAAADRVDLRRRRRDHVCAYEPGDAASIVEAFRRAETYHRSTIETASIRSWQEAVQLLFDHKDVR